jgi:RimJ/RimL family protein N-acetyltransferase
MKLIPFTQDNYPLLISWLPNAEFAWLWGGPRYHWPIDASQLAAYLADNSVNTYLFVDDDHPIGYIELVQKPAQEIRLCRILIADPQARGKGYGTQLIKMAMDKAKTEFGATTIELGVFEQNVSARRCYEKLGFIIYEQDDSLTFDGNVWPLLRMRVSTRA